MQQIVVHLDLVVNLLLDGAHSSVLSPHLHTEDGRVLDVLIEFVRRVDVLAAAEADVRHIDQHAVHVLLADEALAFTHVEHFENEGVKLCIV